MTKVFHIHDVLDILHTATAPLTVKTLMQVVEEKFGKDPMFTSCSDTQFGKDGIIAFLQSRQKISLEDDRIELISHSCNH